MRVEAEGHVSTPWAEWSSSLVDRDVCEQARSTPGDAEGLLTCPSVGSVKLMRGVEPVESMADKGEVQLKVESGSDRFDDG